MERLAAWWRARTARERTLLRFAAIFVLAILLPAWAYVAAAQFRADAAARLVSARQIEAQVEQLAEAGRAQQAAPQGGDGSLRGRVLAAAATAGLNPVRVESAGDDRVRVAFAPANSLSVYRWIGVVGAGGAYVARTAIVRVEDSEQVNSEFDVRAGP